MDETHNPFLGEEGDPLLKKREEMMQARGCAKCRLRQAPRLRPHGRWVWHTPWRRGAAWQACCPSCWHPGCINDAAGQQKTRACILPSLLLPALQKRLQRRDGTMMTLAQSKRASELQMDMHAWEEKRLLTSGEG